jgi:hypothetical protein
LNAICPDGFEYSFVDEEFVVGREFGLESEYPVHFGKRESKLFALSKNVCVPGKGGGRDEVQGISHGSLEVFAHHLYGPMGTFRVS